MVLVESVITDDTTHDHGRQDTNGIDYPSHVLFTRNTCSEFSKTPDEEQVA